MRLILAGESCGTAVVAALDEARRIMAADGPAARDAVMVVILPDGRPVLPLQAPQRRVDAEVRAAHLAGAVVRVGELLRDRHHGEELPDLVMARTTQRVGEAIELLQRFGISQLPVSQEPTGDVLEGIVGSVSEQGLLERAYRNPEIVGRTVGEVMDRPFPTVAVEASLDEVFALLSGGASALLAVRSGPMFGQLGALNPSLSGFMR